MMRPSQETQGWGSSYPSMVDKTFKNAVMELIQSQYGSLGGGNRLSDMLASDVSKLADQFFLSKDFIRTGQLVLTVVCASERPRVGKRMANTKLKPITVNLFTDKEIHDWISGMGTQELRKKRMARILKEAYDQGGVMSLGDLSLIHLCTPLTAGRYVHSVENETNTVLPYRGTIHDLGRGVTHKAQIVELYLRGIATTDIKRMTAHSLEACDNYIRGYRRVALLHQRFSVEDIPFLSGMSPSLVNEYIKLGEKYNWKTG